MTTSSESMIKAIADTLRDGVLPVLETASWPAGNLRACLMLLAYLEERIRLEGPLLFDSNAVLRGLLAEIASGDGMPQDAELISMAEAVVQKHPARAAFVGVEALAQENADYLEAVSRIIKHSHARRADTDPGRYDNLRAKLDACALAAGVPENAFTEKALRMVPV